MNKLKKIDPVTGRDMCNGKFTTEEVWAIRAAYDSHSSDFLNLARGYACSVDTIKKIGKRITYGFVPEQGGMMQGMDKQVKQTPQVIQQSIQSSQAKLMELLQAQEGQTEPPSLESIFAKELEQVKEE